MHVSPSPRYPAVPVNAWHMLVLRGVPRICVIMVCIMVWHLRGVARKFAPFVLCPGVSFTRGRAYFCTLCAVLMCATYARPRVSWSVFTSEVWGVRGGMCALCCCHGPPGSPPAPPLMWCDVWVMSVAVFVGSRVSQ